MGKRSASIMSKDLKLWVEVVGANNLIPKDGQGSNSAYVELYFDGQTFLTSIKERDLNPVWNESFDFNISDPSSLPGLTLEANVFNNIRGSSTRDFLGKVTLDGPYFVPYSDADVVHYPLEKRGIFSNVRGNLALKVYTTDNMTKTSSAPVNAAETFLNKDPSVTHTDVHAAPKCIGRTFSCFKTKLRHSSPLLPNQNSQHQNESSSTKIHRDDTKNVPKHQTKYESTEPPNPVSVHSVPSLQPIDYALKETSPDLGVGRVVGGRVIRKCKTVDSNYSLVERMYFLYVRVVKARELPVKDVTRSIDPFVEMRIGNFKGIIKHVENNPNPEWNQVFAFLKDHMQGYILEVVIQNKNRIEDDFIGVVRFDMNLIPLRVPSESAVAAEWYSLEDKKGDKIKSEIMLSVWIGTQADEAFSDAWHSDAAMPGSIPVASTTMRSKVYDEPRLWYVRVNIIEAGLIPAEMNRFQEVYAKAQIGNQVLRTRPVQAQTRSHIWNEDLLFVAAEPFEDHVVLSVEAHVDPGKCDNIGRAIIPIDSTDMRTDDKMIRPRWFNLENPSVGGECSSRIHVRVCLDGGYHVLDEATHYSSDLRPTAKHLWKPPIGVLELGILNAAGLHPMKTRDRLGTIDTYCVAKYGHKWVRTRTIVNNLFPKYNEQYTWEVFDLATVLTVGVFDDSQLGTKRSDGSKDLRLGKVRIRISTLEAGRIYTHSYPLLVLHPTGIKKMGELHLAIRFSCTSFANMFYQYSRPLLPKMHYVKPLSVTQVDNLRYEALKIVAARFSGAEPPLRREVVEYMSDADSQLWSMRRAKANFFRIMSVISVLIASGTWFGDIRRWKNPITSMLVHVVFLMLVCFPRLVLPVVFFSMFLKGLWNLRWRPRFPPVMDPRCSYADSVHLDELDEEFDTFPTSRSSDIVRMRYDRLRSVAGRLQTVAGDVATQGEKMLALLSWRDPRATTIFVILCLVATMVLYVTPFQVVMALIGLYVMRHPRFRYRSPAAHINFFRRLPARIDSLL